MVHIRCSQQCLVQSKYFLLALEIILVQGKKKKILKRHNPKKLCRYKNRILTQAWCPLRHWDTPKAWDTETTKRFVLICATPSLLAEEESTEYTSTLTRTQDERNTRKIYSFKTGCKYQATHTQNTNLTPGNLIAGKRKSKAAKEISTMCSTAAQIGSHGSECPRPPLSCTILSSGTPAPATRLVLSEKERGLQGTSAYSCKNQELFILTGFDSNLSCPFKKSRLGHM